jgi:branched-chain amino acid transport system permease protein
VTGPRIATPWLIVGALALAVPLLWRGSDYALFLLNMAVIHTLLAVSLNVVFGYLGLLSLGQAGFYALGAYVSAALVLGAGLPFAIGLAGAVVASALAGLLVAFPAIRIRGHYFVLITLGFGEIVRLVLLNWKAVTRGTDGIIGIPAPALGPFVVSTKLRYYYLGLVLLALVLVLTAWLRRSSLGRACLAIKDNELAASACGVNPTIVKLSAFGWSAAIAGLAGSLYAHLFTFISPEVFTIDVSVAVLLMVLVGGAGTASGPVIGAVLLTFLPEWLRPLKQYYMILYGAAVVAVMVFMPEGLVGIVARLRMTRRQAAAATP